MIDTLVNMFIGVIIGYTFCLAVNWDKFKKEAKE